MFRALHTHKDQQLNQRQFYLWKVRVRGTDKMTAEIEVLESLKNIEDCGRIAAEGQERWKAKVKNADEGHCTIAHENGSSCNKQTKENVHLLKKWVEIESESDNKRLNMQWSNRIVVLPCNASSGSEKVVLLCKTTLQQMFYLHICSNST